jgi:hypothetical protein
MPIAINGSGTITGVSVGGLPDGIVDTDMIAADAVTAAKVGTKTFTSYAIIADKKASNGDGGSITNGAWRTRDLNTEIADPDNIVSISSNQFTLGAGSYLIEFRAPAYQLNSHQTRLYNATASAEVEVGSSEFTNTAGQAHSVSEGAARVTITGNTVFEIQHRVSVSSSNTYALGVGSAGGHNWGSTVYTIVKISKEA